MQHFDIGGIFVQYVLPWTEQIAGALLIFLLGGWVAKKLAYLADRLMERVHVDGLVRRFLYRIIYWLGLCIVLVAALEKLGVNTTSALAVLGAAGLAVGLALKDSLSNVASGVMIVLFRPFDKGHYIEAGGVGGTVKEVGLFSTRLRTPDNRSVIVPNAEIYSGSITNYSANATRRIDLIFGIGYEDDIKQAKAIIMDIISKDERILTKPEPYIGVSELADSCVNIMVRPWVRTDCFLDTKSDLLERIKVAFDEHGISIPYPQQDVTIRRVNNPT